MNFDGIERDGVHLIENALTYDPDSPPLLASAAQFYLTYNVPPIANVHASRAVELDENYAEAWRLLGNSELAMGNSEAARSSYLIAAKLDPSLVGLAEGMAALET